MDVRHLDIFVTVAECPTFTEAARRLGVTQATVSYQVAELEKRLGMKLFIRDRASVRLTRAGVILHQGGRRILSSLGELIEQARAADSGQAGSLKFGFVGSLEPVMSEALRRIRRKLPSLELGLERFNMNELEAALDADRVDLALTYAIGPPCREDFVYRELGSEPTQVVLCPDHPLATREHLGLADLTDIPVALFSKEAGGPSRQWLLGQFARAGGIPATLLDAITPESLLLQVESGMAVTLLTHKVVESLPQFKLCCVPLREELPVRTVLAWRRMNSNPCVEAALEAWG